MRPSPVPPAVVVATPPRHVVPPAKAPVPRAPLAPLGRFFTGSGKIPLVIAIAVVVGWIVLSSWSDEQTRAMAALRDSLTANPVNLPRPLPTISNEPRDGLGRMTQAFGEGLEELDVRNRTQPPAYVARLSAADHFTHQGRDLRQIPDVQVRDILLQDRLNLHLYSSGDPEDQPDHYYKNQPLQGYRDIYNYRRLRVIPEGSEAAIIYGTPLVEVTMAPFEIAVRILNSRSTPGSAQPR